MSEGASENETVETSAPSVFHQTQSHRPMVHTSPSLVEEQENLNQAYLAMLGRLKADNLIQTDRQPVWWRCWNPDCIPDRRNHKVRFEFKSEYGECPKCGQREPAVTKRTLIHFLVRNPKGEIVGAAGIRYSLACDLKRYTVTNGRDGESATGDMVAVNCPGCIKAAKVALARYGHNLILGE